MCFFVVFHIFFLRSQDSCNVRGCSATTGQCFSTPVTCNDSDSCTVDSCVLGLGCQYVPLNCAVNDTTCTKFSCVSGNCVPRSITCDDNQPCTLDACVEPSGCTYTPVVCAQSSTCFVTECLGGDSNGRPLCAPTTPINCTDNSSCTIDRCVEGVGCVVSQEKKQGSFFFLNLFVFQHLPFKCSPTTECNFPVGCNGTGAVPVCILQNITSLFDFCGVCRGDNVACFFSTVIGAQTIAAITGGAVAGIAIAAIIAAAIMFWLAKKGYE